MRHFTKIIFTSLFYISCQLSVYAMAQEPQTWLNSELDTIFSEVDSPNHPAVTALAIHKGKVVYKKAFGSSDLDNKIPATIDTKFQLASMSRHFTAFAILMLEEQGKLSLQDNIRKYLPALPRYENTITIDHLLSMTSGLSDFWPMSDMIGLHEEDVLTQDHVLSTIGKLKPAFKPGECYIYGHSDQVLLAEIVAKVSGKSFASFMKENLFKPLGMGNTLVKEAHHQIMDGAAESYMSTESSYRRSVINFGVYGPINIYSTVNDLAKWELNLLNPKVGSKSLVDKLFTSVKLNNGKPINAWAGQFTYAQQFYHWGHGVKEIYQMGILGGHASAMFKFPDQEFTVIILSSGMQYSGYLGMGLADHFVGEHFFNDEPNDFARLKTKKLGQKKLEKYTGTYWSDRSGFSRKIEIRNDTLTYVRGDGRASRLLPISDNRFQMMVGGRVFITFVEEGGNMIMNFESATLEISGFGRVKPSTKNTTEQMKAAAGSYYNSLHNIVYDLKFGNGQLVASHPRVGNINLRPITTNIYEGDQWYFQSIRFDEDMSGFSLNSEEIRGLRFEKINSEKGI